MDAGLCHSQHGCCYQGDQKLGILFDMNHRSADLKSLTYPPTLGSLAFLGYCQRSAHPSQVASRLRIRLLQRVDRRAAQLELAARLQGDALAVPLSANDLPPSFMGAQPWRSTRPIRMCAICSYDALCRPPPATVSFSCSVPILRESAINVRPMFVPQVGLGPL